MSKDNNQKTIDSFMDELDDLLLDLELLDLELLEEEWEEPFTLSGSLVDIYNNTIL